jgi:hypothetical protein
LTITVKEHVDWLPAASFAAHSTVVTPSGKIDPEGGLQTTVGSEQLSATASAKLTTAEHWPGSVAMTTPEGQLIMGGSVSEIVTVALDVPLDPSWSVTINVTWHVPGMLAEPSASIGVGLAGSSKPASPQSVVQA